MCVTGVLCMCRGDTYLIVKNYFPSNWLWAICKWIVIKLKPKSLKKKVWVFCFCFYFCFFKIVPHYRFGWPWTHINLPAYVSQMLGQRHAPPGQLKDFFFFFECVVVTFSLRCQWKCLNSLRAIYLTEPPFSFPLSSQKSLGLLLFSNNDILSSLGTCK